jgi:multimeric flavodoxin WrbA
VQAAILNCAQSPEDPADAAAALLEARMEAGGADVRHFVLRRFDVGHCLGEFDCWVRHPGRCRIKDAGQEIERAVHGADVCALVTSVTFGGYAPELKKALDRLNPLILPFFAKRAGFTQHLGRSEDLPRIVGIGVDSKRSDARDALFLAHIEATALNLGVAGWNGVVLGPGPAGRAADLDAVLGRTSQPAGPPGGPAEALAELEHLVRPELADGLRRLQRHRPRRARRDRSRRSQRRVSGRPGGRSGARLHHAPERRHRFPYRRRWLVREWSREPGSLPLDHLNSL